MTNTTENPTLMSFDDALEKLGIADFKERIFNSNSHGELFHLMDYIHIAQAIPDEPEKFREWFVETVAAAEQQWKRPESVFQHIPTLLMQGAKP